MSDRENSLSEKNAEMITVLKKIKSTDACGYEYRTWAKECLDKLYGEHIEQRKEKKE